MQRPLDRPATARRPYRVWHAVRNLVWSCAACLVLVVSAGAAAADTPVLVRFIARSDTSVSSVAGVLVAEDAQELRVLDLETLQERSFRKDAARFVKNPATEQDVAAVVGIAPVVSWFIANALPSRPKLGRIASVDGPVAYVNLGEEAGIAARERLDVFRGHEPISDPESGEILGTKQRRIAQVEVTEVRDRLSKVRPLGDFEVRLEVGDVVRPVAAEHPVAVLPFGRDSGQLIQGGVQLAEQVTSSLTKNGVVVVERAVLNEVLKELSLSETGAFDLDTARKIGKLLQAYAIVSGTIQVNPRDANVNIRLIELETGRILYATSLTVKNLNTTPVRSSVLRDGRAPVRLQVPAAPVDSGSDPAADLSGPRKLREFVAETDGAVRAVRFSPDGRRAVSGGNDTIVRIWDLEKGIDVRHLIGHTTTINAVAWLPDGQTIVSGDYHATIKIWNAETGQELASLQAADDVRSLAIFGECKNFPENAS